VCLNLGCGRKPIASTEVERWFNLDVRPLPGVDVVRDLRRGLPWFDSTFDHILCDNVLEHFDSDDVVFLLNEMDRVLLDGGTIDLIVPHFRSQGAVQDPTHKSFFCERSALYWNQTTTIHGGKAVGIGAHLYAESIRTLGNFETEAFLRFALRKRVANQERTADRQVIYMVRNEKEAAPFVSYEEAEVFRDRILQLLPESKPSIQVMEVSTLREEE